MIFVELVKSHAHAGKDHPAGHRLSVSDTEAAWLIEAGIARPATEADGATSDYPQPSGSINHNQRSGANPARRSRVKTSGSGKSGASDPSNAASFPKEG